jgi:O-antigen ligase
MNPNDQSMPAPLSIRGLVRFILSARHNREAQIFNVELLAAIVAALLPWSTSAISVLAVLWFVALIPTLDLRDFMRSCARPISAFPIALFGLALAGTLWSDAPSATKLYSVGPAAKLLLLPPLFYHYERSERGLWVFKTFLASCALMSVASWIVLFDPSLSMKPYSDVTRGIFVKNYIDQSQEFSLCAVVLAFPIFTLTREGKFPKAAVLGLLAFAFLLNMIFVIVSRTALVTIPVMLGVFALLHFQWRTNLIAFCVVAIASGFTWMVSPQLQRTFHRVATDYQIYTEQMTQPTSIGFRLEFWRKSLAFFAASPVIGNGTGSTLGLFERAAVGPVGLAPSEVIANPHNQTLNVAIQWGIIGVAILYAMWMYHFLLFRGEGLASWIGLMVVVQNMLTSLFNSHLFDFHEGWMYVLGVGVAGGMVLRLRLSANMASKVTLPPLADRNGL